MARGLDINADYDDQEDGGGGGAGQDMRVSEWEDGLPSADDLTPLSQPLIPPELASAFSITPEPSRTLLDVHRASQTTISSLRRQPNPFAAAAAPGRRRIPHFAVQVAAGDHAMAATEEVEEDEEDCEADADADGDGGGTSGSSSSAAAEEGAGGGLMAEMSDLQQQQLQQQQLDQGGAVAKRARLVWTPQLHRRFVEVVAHLGVANAVPKTIMQLMNVEGLTRENVASHLQKYRLYLKRTHGLDDASAGAAGPLPSGSFASSAYPRQQAQQRLPASAEGAGLGSTVRVPPPTPTSYTTIPTPQSMRHGHGMVELERPPGGTSNLAGLAFPRRAHITPNNNTS